MEFQLAIFRTWEASGSFPSQKSLPRLRCPFSLIGVCGGQLQGPQPSTQQDSAVGPALHCLSSTAEHAPRRGFQVTQFYPVYPKGQKQLVPRQLWDTEPGIGESSAGNLATPQQASCWSFPKGVCCAGVWTLRWLREAQGISPNLY